MVEVPGAIPSRIPVLYPIVATEVLPEIQVPPDVEEDRDIDDPAQRIVVPEIPVGPALIVIINVVLHPVLRL